MIEQPVFFVQGSPVPQGSKSAMRHSKSNFPILIDQNAKKLKPWRQTIADTARANGWGASLLDGPVAVALVFVFARPDTHFGKRGLKASAPLYPDRREDVDKLTRAALDALTGIVWSNDARVCIARAVKMWSHIDGLLIEIQPCAPMQAGDMDIVIDTKCLDEVSLLARDWWPGTTTRPVQRRGALLSMSSGAQP